jgi:F0F1-type ATP synthase delta subunit
MNPEPYAQALYQMLKEGMRPKEAVAKLRAVLRRQGRERLLSRIEHAFARIATRNEKKNTVTLSIARAKDKRKAQSAVKGLLKEMGISSKELAVEIDESLIGGWRLEGRERLVDASFKKDLLSLYNRVTQ